MTQKRQIIVTNALPYANAPLHLGHMLEYTQTDIWVRFQRMRKNDCYYMSADDAHGTPIMLTASQKGISPEEHIDKLERVTRLILKIFLSVLIITTQPIHPRTKNFAKTFFRYSSETNI